MKLRRDSSNEGGILVITIVICALVGLMLSAYLSMVSSQHTFTQHSQVWNNVIPMCESGVEHAMAHINHKLTTTNFAINGWVKDGSVFRKKMYMNGGRCDMEIDNGWPPIITVKGSLKEPLSNRDIVRTIRVRTKMNQRFPAAVLAKGNISLNGSGLINSFNSTNYPAECGLNGQYDPAKATDRALVATTARTAPALTVGTMLVYGYAATGPGGTVTCANSGGLGSTAWVNGAGRGSVEPARVSTDANYYIPPAALPNDFRAAPLTVLPGLYPPPPAIGVNYTYLIVQDGDYLWNGDLVMDNTKKMLVAAHCRLRVRGSFTIKNSGFLQMETNSYMEVYVEGPVSVGGSACINKTGHAINFSLIVIGPYPVDYGGTGKLIGTIYAPLSRVNLQGSSDAIGAVTCDNFVLGGGMGIHFDEALRGNPKIRFLASSWSEIQL